MNDAERTRLVRTDAGLLVVDVQERLVPAMAADRTGDLLRAVRLLIRGARVLDLPIVVTEQYPKGLGPTVAAVVDALPPGQPRLAKTSFSCCADAAIGQALEAADRRQWIVCGIEAHVCVLQTVRDLAARGHDVFVPADGVLSRRLQDRDAGLRAAERVGAFATCAEAVLFDLLGGAAAPEFRAISALVRE